MVIEDREEPPAVSGGSCRRPCTLQLQFLSIGSPSTTHPPKSPPKREWREIPKLVKGSQWVFYPVSLIFSQSFCHLFCNINCKYFASSEILIGCSFRQISHHNYFFFFHSSFLCRCSASHEHHLLFPLTDFPNTYVLTEFPRPGHNIKHKKSKTNNSNKNVVWLDKSFSIMHHFKSLRNCHQ